MTGLTKLYLTGTSMENLADAAEHKSRLRGRTVLAALVFVLGFTTVFVAFGASASAIGGFVQRWSAQLSLVAGIRGELQLSVCRDGGRKDDLR